MASLWITVASVALNFSVKISVYRCAQFLPGHDHQKTQNNYAYEHAYGKGSLEQKGMPINFGTTGIPPGAHRVLVESGLCN